jgi:hypothetical protein
VIANAATERWLQNDPRGPGWVRLFERVTAPALSRVPMQMQRRAAAAQSPNRPVFGPAAPVAGGPENLIEAGPLYAGECIDRINDVRPAGELVRELAP